MNHPEKTQPQRAQEDSEQAVQEALSKLQEGFSVLDEKLLDEIVGAGWPLGLPGVQKALHGLTRSNSAPGRMESASFHHSPPRSPSSVESGNTNMSGHSFKEMLRSGTTGVFPSNSPTH